MSAPEGLRERAIAEVQNVIDQLEAVIAASVDQDSRWSDEGSLRAWQYVRAALAGERTPRVIIGYDNSHWRNDYWRSLAQTADEEGGRGVVSMGTNELRRLLDAFERKHAPEPAAAVAADPQLREQAGVIMAAIIRYRNEWAAGSEPSALDMARLAVHECAALATPPAATEPERSIDSAGLAEAAKALREVSALNAENRARVAILTYLRAVPLYRAPPEPAAPTLSNESAPALDAGAAIQAKRAFSISEAARTIREQMIADSFGRVSPKVEWLESVIARAVGQETERLMAAARRLRDCEVPGSDDWESCNSCLVNIMQEAGRMDADGRAVQGETARLREALQQTYIAFVEGKFGESRPNHRARSRGQRHTHGG